MEVLGVVFGVGVTAAEVVAALVVAALVDDVDVCVVLVDVDGVGLEDDVGGGGGGGGATSP